MQTPNANYPFFTILVSNNNASLTTFTVTGLSAGTQVSVRCSLSVPFLGSSASFLACDGVLCLQYAFTVSDEHPHHQHNSETHHLRVVVTWPPSTSSVSALTRAARASIPPPSAVSGVSASPVAVHDTELSARRLRACAAPSQIAAGPTAAQVTTTTILLQWQPAAYVGGSLSGYRVWMSTNGGAFVMSSSNTNNAYQSGEAFRSELVCGDAHLTRVFSLCAGVLVTGLTPATNYAFQVRFQRSLHALLGFSSAACGVCEV